MKILVIGGTGTIGKVVSKRLGEKDEVIIAGRNSGEVNMDIGDKTTIQAALEKTEKLDAIVCVAGQAKWAAFNDLSEEDYFIGIKSKLMGQVNLVRIGQQYLNPKGSITLTTGILADDPVMKTTSAAMVNGALHSFVRAVALEIENGIRVNVVSVGVVQDAYEKYKDIFAGYSPIPMDKVANAYVRSVHGKRSGEIIRVYE